ncbi:MAG: PQQ-binding-like beta-propeller repeat protein [Acidobacteriia bacterium]|nr:PQQ-binding-like beta-propeller repeat protein [Terriglobia bacterium]
MRTCSALFLALTALSPLLAQDGAALYKDRCAMCHDRSAETRAPAPTALRQMSPENVVRALESGLMKDQGASLSAAQRNTLAEFLTGKTIGQPAPQAKPNTCPNANAAFSPSGPGWNGWGVDLSNARFQSAAQAGLDAAQIPRLKLKWAFAFPNTFAANGQPTVVGGRIFVPGANRRVYALDARSGCEYWSIETQAPVRTAITVAGVRGERVRQVAFFGDQRANAYAVDASSGELLWKVHVEDHPQAKIVGAPQYSDARVYVPVTDAEEGPAMSPKFECCTGRGALVALDALTGKQIWKTYTIDEKAHPTTKNSAGTQMWGPSGASIWSAPTIDLERKIIYAATGDNFSSPATKTSDAVLAFDMQTGKLLWSKQITEQDVFNMACVPGPSKASCPEENGPDLDLGASPILVKAANGKRVLLVSQKSGVATGLDADHDGSVLWQTRVGHGSPLGGIQWGSASDGKNMYVPLSDITFIDMEFGTGKKLLLNPKGGGGLFALDVLTGKNVWTAPPASCGDRPNCSPAQSAAVSAMPGVVFSGAVDGHLRGYSTRNGAVIWDFDTAQEFNTVNGLTAKGGSMDGPGPVIAGGMLYVCSGYGAWGGMPGNVLLAFSPDGK